MLFEDLITDDSSNSSDENSNTPASTNTTANLNPQSSTTQQPAGQQSAGQPQVGWYFGNILSGVGGAASSVVNGVTGAVTNTILIGRDAARVLGGTLYKATNYLTPAAKTELLQPLAERIRAIKSAHADSITTEQSTKCDAMIEIIELLITDDSKASWKQTSTADNISTQDKVKALQQKIDGMRWLMHPEIQDELTRQLAQAVLDCLKKINPREHLADPIYAAIADNCDESYCHWKALTIQTESLLARYQSWVAWQALQAKSAQLSQQCEQFTTNVKQAENFDQQSCDQIKLEITQILTEVDNLPYILLAPEQVNNVQANNEQANNPQPNNLHKGWKQTGGQATILRQLLEIEMLVNSKLLEGTTPLQASLDYVQSQLSIVNNNNLHYLITATESRKLAFADEFSRYNQGDAIKFKSTSNVGAVVAAGANLATSVVQSTLQNALGYILTTDDNKKEILQLANDLLQANLNLQDAGNENSTTDSIDQVIKTWAALQLSIENHENVVSASEGSKPPRRAAYLLHTTSLDFLNIINNINVKQDSGLHQLIRKHQRYADTMKLLLVQAAQPKVEASQTGYKY